MKFFFTKKKKNVFEKNDNLIDVDNIGVIYVFFFSFPKN